jgi:hypothetical protein
MRHPSVLSRAEVLCALFGLIIAGAPHPGTAAELHERHLEIRIAANSDAAHDPIDARPYMVLSCRGEALGIYIDWRQRVGQPGGRRRHLFYHLDGDRHLMLPVLDRSGRRTGYLNQSAKAKSLIASVLQTMQPDVVPIGVFPAGRDHFTGEWINAFFPSAEFRKAVSEVSRMCNWKPTDPATDEYARDFVPPEPPSHP